MMTFDDSPFIDQIRQKRLSKGWSIRRLAEECQRLGAASLTEASIGNLERGIKPGSRPRRKLRVDELRALADALEMPLSGILRRSYVGERASKDDAPGAAPEAMLVAAAGVLIAHGQSIWGQRASTPTEVAVLAGVVVGDLARAARDEDPDGLRRELGNMMLSAGRWASELGLDPAECLAVADEAQRAYVEREMRETGAGRSGDLQPAPPAAE